MKLVIPMKRLPDSELEVMKALWASGPDTTRSQLEKALSPFGLASNTVNTYLTRLQEKGFVSVKRDGKLNRYTPLVSQEDYRAFDSQSILSKLYDGSPTKFVAALAKGGMTKDDVAELRSLLDELSGGNHG